MRKEIYESNPRLAKLAGELAALNNLAVKLGLSDEQKLSLLRIHVHEATRHEIKERAKGRREYSSWHRVGVDYEPLY